MADDLSYLDDILQRARALGPRTERLAQSPTVRLLRVEYRLERIERHLKEGIKGADGGHYARLSKLEQEFAVLRTDVSKIAGYGKMFLDLGGEIKGYGKRIAALEATPKPLQIDDTLGDQKMRQIGPFERRLTEIENAIKFLSGKVDATKEKVETLDRMVQEAAKRLNQETIRLRREYPPGGRKEDRKR